MYILRNEENKMKKINISEQVGLYGKITKVSATKRKLEVFAYGIDLTKGQRTLTSTVPEEIAEDAAFFNEFLNKKAQEAIDNDPMWSIKSLSEWKTWATGYMNEFYEKDALEMAKEIEAKQQAYLKEQGIIE